MEIVYDFSIRQSEEREKVFSESGWQAQLPQLPRYTS